MEEEEDNAQESFFENEQEEQRTYEEWLDRIETLRSYLSKAAASGDGVTAGLRSTVHELRRARTCFQVAFPFSESMWLAWIADETATQNDASLADASLDDDAMMKLLHRACTADYAVSWPLWSAYIDATKRVFGASDPLRVRAAHEEAVKAMGAHVVEGHLVWMSYIAHEEGSGVISTAELEHLKSRMASTALSSCNNGLLNEDARLFLKACEPFEARIATVLRQHGAGGDVERAEPGGGALGDCTELAAAWMDYIDFALKWKRR